MKKCPYCAEEIKDEAVICRYCNQKLKKGAGPLPWCYKFSVIFSLGPLGIPLIMFHPKINKKVKTIWISAVVISVLVSALLIWFLWPLLQSSIVNIEHMYDYDYLLTH